MSWQAYVAFGLIIAMQIWHNWRFKRLEETTETIELLTTDMHRDVHKLAERKLPT